MKKRRNNPSRASTLQIALSTGLISISAILFAIAAPAKRKGASPPDPHEFQLEEGADADSITALGNYPDTSVPLSGDTTVMPDAPPTNTTSINVSIDSNFKGTFAASQTTGVVTVTDAYPAGSYTVIVTAFGPGGTTTKTFTLTVTSGIPCGANFTAGFTNAADVNSGIDPTSVAIGDFNGDGNQDLAVANQTSNTVSIRLGDGLGSFSGSTNVSVDTSPNSVAIGDFNGDGNQDFATANFRSNTVSIRLGDGLGGFSGSTNFSVGTFASSVAIGDFNADGKQDLAVANAVSDTISILLGDGLGGFSGSTNVSVGPKPYSVAIGDFNGDGKEDLAVARGEDSGFVSIRLGDGLGGFSGSTDVSVGSNPTSVAIGDFNGDGKQDLATANYGSTTVSIRFGDGLGGFSGSTEVSVGYQPRSVAIGDFNNDGKQDLATANYSSNDVSIRLGDGLGGFSGSTEVSVGTGPVSVAIGDFNGNGKQDLVVANYAASTVSIRPGQCVSAPTPTPTATGTPPPTPTATATATATATPTQTCTPVTVFSENFDGVTAPALPAGWVTSFTPGPADCTPTGTCAFGTDWATTTTTPDTAPNCAFHNDPGCVTDSTLDTPSFVSGTFTTSLTFRHSYDLESGSDGAVLEISVNGGPFTDIITAGGQFVQPGGYNGTISSGSLSPIAGRQAWTGNSGGYIQTTVAFVPGSFQSARLRFRLATDCSGAGTGWGWRIDTISVTYPPGCPSPTPSPNPSPSEFPHRISGTVTYCPNPALPAHPVPGVTMTLTGSSSGSTVTDANGYYEFSSLAFGGSYTVTPTKTARTPGSAGISTADSIAVQRHFLNIGTPLSGCRLAAADVSIPPNGVTTSDAIAIQRFFLNLTGGLAQVGTYQFTPVRRLYTPLIFPQTDQNYDALILGDVATGFVH